MNDLLPTFVYHPDPIATGAVVQSQTECRTCRRSRGLIYTGPVFAVEELVDELCPWCIADGSAAAAFDAQFTDVGVGVPEGVSDAVLEVIAQRTPGFSGWQQERWLYHCGDGASFLGRAGFAELNGRESALATIRAEYRGFGWADAELEELVRSLHVDGEATAYLFECRHCHVDLAYADFS